MKTFTVKAYLVAFRFKHTPPGEATWALSTEAYKPGEHGAIGCWPHDITVPLPEDFNPVAEEVAALNKQKALVLESYQRTVADINERLSKLLAITNEVEA